MSLDFSARLDTFAEIIVRVGLNLQPGQRLLIAEPYELQGVARDAAALVDAVTATALKNGCASASSIEVIWGDAKSLREFVVNKDWNSIAQLAGTNADKMDEYVRQGDALLFLLGSQPRLMEGIPSRQVSQARNICSEHFGAVAQQLVRGDTNWTAVPSPSPEWADVVYGDLSVEQRLPALWNTVFEAMRVEGHVTPLNGAGENEGKTRIQSLDAWQTHLGALEKRRDELNAQRFKSIRYEGPGTDLTVDLPREHLWCTASLRTKAGVKFVANLPTEEVFTLPHKDSARGKVRIARPITFGGAVIDGIELEFQWGRVINATARTGDALLQRLLSTDPGACRLGEVALIVNSRDPSRESDAPQWSKGRLLHHVLLDENAASHIALGEGYGFCLNSPNPEALNRSLIHVDLSIAATANLHR